MAAKATSAEGLQKLEEQLTCPICLERFNNPKILPCFHSFCLHCLQRVPIELVKGGHYLSCPTCRSSCPVPDEGLATLPSSFVINNFIEVHGLMKKVSGDQHTVSCDNCDNTNANRYCKQCAKFLCPDCLLFHDKWKPNATHEAITLEKVASTANQLPHTRPEGITNCTDHNKPQEIYCETCQELICQLCTVKKHRDHEYDVVCDVSKRYRDAINQSSLQPLEREIDQLAQAKTTLINRRDEIHQQAKTAEVEIDQMITQLKDQLDEKGKKLKRDVNLALNLKAAVLDHQIKEVDRVSSQALECRDRIEQCVTVATPRQIIASKEQLMEGVMNIVKHKNFQPLEKADIEFVPNAEFNLVFNTTSIGNVEQSLARSTVRVVSDAKGLCCQIGKNSSMVVSLRLLDDSPALIPSSFIQCRLTPPNNHGCQPIECTVMESSQSGQYDVSFTPVTRGCHQLHITIQNKEVEGSPVGVVATIPPEMMTKPVTTITGLKEPKGVAVSDDGLLVVSEGRGHCITILDQEGNKVRSFGSEGSGHGQLCFPIGLATSSKGTILVADSANHRIQEFTMKGECVSCVGSFGSGPLQFTGPYGITVSKTTGQVFVTEYSNQRIQVLNPDLTFSHIWGGYGRGKGQFIYPHDVAVDDQGFVYATDIYNSRVLKFTTEGRFVSLVECKINDLPVKTSGITIDTCNNLYINDDGGCSLLKTDLQIIGFVGERIKSRSFLRTYEGIYYDNNTGYLYVVSGTSINIF